MGVVFAIQILWCFSLAGAAVPQSTVQVCKYETFLSIKEYKSCIIRSSILNAHGCCPRHPKVSPFFQETSESNCIPPCDFRLSSVLQTSFFAVSWPVTKSICDQDSTLTIQRTRWKHGDCDRWNDWAILGSQFTTVRLDWHMNSSCSASRFTLHVSWPAQVWLLRTGRLF